MKLTEKKLKGKFVIAYDTLCTGWDCMMDGEEGDKNYAPTLFKSEDEAFAEIFDGNLAMLESHADGDGEQLEEYNEGVTMEMIEEMNKINSSGDVKAMREFMDKNPQCDDQGEWVEPAETFIMNRKAVFGDIGLEITGTKITDL